MASPLDTILDGHEFQRIVAEYFRCLKDEEHRYKITDIEVEDNGEGPDGGCDILVVFHFEDAIKQHSHRWVVECKFHNKSVGVGSVDTNNLYGVLKSNNANGYLLVCKKDASTTLRQRFRDMSANEDYDFVIWNGTQLWRKFVERKSLLKAFFPSFYKAKIEDSDDQSNFDKLYKKYQQKNNER